MVSLAFYLFVVRTVIFALCSCGFDSSCPLVRCRQPPWSRILAPGVFKPRCSTPFTLFLRLVSVYRPCQLYFIPKTLHNTSVFSSLLTAYFYLTGHSPVFIYKTTLLHILLLTLCGHLQTQRVCRALHPVSGEDGLLVAEVTRGGPTRFFGPDFP